MSDPSRTAILHTTAAAFYGWWVAWAEDQSTRRSQLEEGQIAAAPGYRTTPPEAGRAVFALLAVTLRNGKKATIGPLLELATLPLTPDPPRLQVTIWRRSEAAAGLYDKLAGAIAAAYPEAAAALLEPEPLPEGEYMFLRRGDGWLLAWEGKRATVKDSKGMAMLHVLLQNVGRPYSALELEAAAEGRGVWDPSDAPLEAQAELLRQAGLGGGSNGDEPGKGPLMDGETGDTIADPQALEEARAEIERIKARLAKQNRPAATASKGNAYNAQDRAKDDRDLAMLEAYIKRALLPGGDLRNTPDPEAEKARGRKNSAITTAMGKIKKALPDIYGHLNRWITTPGGVLTTYDPNRLIPWILGK